MASLQQHRDLRSSKRNFLHAAAEVRLPGLVGAHVAVVRDLSQTGLFLYSDFKPPVGAQLRITLKPSFVGHSDDSFYCEGTVVRVEQARPSAAFGIGIRLTNKLAPLHMPKPDTMKLAAYRV